ncbi:MAG: lipopolysaccharide heptosyltransferase II [Pseudomonadota bacterium]|nr:lipopolysaccharide heptosyltransferase II [Pseudomonadota bacterium]
MKSNKKVLIIAPSWIGDLIIAHSLFKELKLKDKNVIIDLVIRSYLKPIADMMPEINKKHILDIPHGSLGLLDRYYLSRKIKLEKYNQAFILTNSFKAAIIPWLAKIPIRVGYVGEMRYGVINKIHKEKRFEKSMVNRFLKLNESIYQESIAPKLSLNKEKLQKIINKFGIEKNNKIIVLCPEAEYGEAKRWPIEKWCELAITFSKKNYKVYFLGKHEHTKSYINKKIIKSPNIISLITKTSVEEAIYLLASSNLVVTNDSGLMHVAASVGTKIVAIFGSSSPQYTAPLLKERDHKIMYSNLSCSPCFKRTCPLKHLNCLTSISSEEVATKASHLL